MFHRKRMLLQLDDEIREHIAMETQDNIERGMPPEEARYAAVRKFGNVTRLKEETREVWSLVWLEQLLEDLRFGVRMLRKNPGFTAVAVLTLALGIGANTAIFTVFNAVLLRPLPYRDSQRLAILWSTDKIHGEERDQVSSTDVEDYHRLNHVFEGVTAIQDWYPTVSGKGEPERAYAIAVGADYFQILRGAPLLGRTFEPEEQRDGKDNVVVLSYGYWQSHFAGDPQIVGQTMVLNALPHTIIGVMPKDFHSLPRTLVKDEAQLYRPVAEPYDNNARSSRHLRAIARLKPGVSWEQAQAEMTRIATNLAKEYPKNSSYIGVRVASLSEDTVGNVRPLLRVLLGPYCWCC